MVVYWLLLGVFWLHNSNFYICGYNNNLNLYRKKRDEVVELVSQVVSLLSEKEKKEVLDRVLGKKEGVPISIFNTKGLSGLEVITVYLKDHEKQSIKEIAASLNRETNTIYTTYSNAKNKLRKTKLNISGNSLRIPIKTFSQRKFSILESLIFFLQDQENLSLKEISTLLNKNYNTVKTVSRRHSKKTHGKN